MKYKRYIVISLNLIMLLSLIGCNNKNIEEKNSTEIKVATINEDIEINENIEIKKEVSEEDKIKEMVYIQKDDLTKLVNKNNSLDNSYEPSDLIKANVKSTKSNILIRDICEKSLEEMFNGAYENEIILSLVSGYRSYSYQTTIYNNSLKKQGLEHTSLYVAKPGQSEHQTGLAVDISSSSNNFALTSKLKNTLEGEWLKQNAHKYGFILRYTEDRVDDTGYGFEPWHFRYVGTEIATYIYEHNLILEDLF